MPITEEQEIRLRCIEIAMKASVVLELSIKASVIADDIYEWVMKEKPKES